jgi:glucose/arabinose dehydrogenase
VHRVDVAKLPAPYETPSANNFPRVVPKPAGAKLSLPPGFKVEVFATGFTGPRAMKLAPNGDILLAETNGGRIKVLRPSADGTKAADTVFAQGLLQPYGMALYPAGANPKWLYVAEVNRVVRYPYTVGATTAAGVPEVVIAELSPVGGGHFTRDLAFSPDGKLLYVSVGSQSNVAEDLPKKSAAEVAAWDAEHGTGAAWGNETNRAGVRVFEVGGDTKGRNFATGIRNCVGMTVQPATGDLWCTTNERDMLGDDLVPDYATRVKSGAFYGWPWYYMGKNEDPRLKGLRPDLAGKVTLPDVPFTAHSAATSITFYNANTGSSAFPAQYVGQGFAVLHGSWNRAFRTGHKIVTLPMKNNVPTGEYVDFMTGFITDDGNAWGRPVAIAQAQDGSLLLSDDGSNQIYRISYSKPAVASGGKPGEIVILGERIAPESLTSTADGHVIFGSVGTGTIFRAKPRAATAEVWIKPGTDGLAQIFGVLADNKSNTLYACSNSLGPPPAAGPAPVATLYLFDLKSGSPKSKYPLPGTGAFCNDIAVDGRGNAYVTDTNNMQVGRLAKGGSQIESWAGTDGAFGPKGGVLDGIAVLGDRVIVNTLRTSKLFAVAIGKDGKAGATTEIKTDRVVGSPDGMRSFGSKDLLVVEGAGTGRLSRVTINGDTAKVVTLKEGFPDGPVAVTVVGATGYVLEGQLAASLGPPPAPGTAPPPAKPFKATAVEVGKP